MQKRILLLTCLCAAAMIGMNAQKYRVDDYNDYVYLKDGTVIRGVITEQVPGKHVKVEMLNGSLFVLEEEKIEKISKTPLMISSPSAPALKSPMPTSSNKSLDEYDWSNVSVELSEGDLDVLSWTGFFRFECCYKGIIGQPQGQPMVLDTKEIGKLRPDASNKANNVSGSLRKNFVEKWNSNLRHGISRLRLTNVSSVVNCVNLHMEEQPSDNPNETPMKVRLEFFQYATSENICVLQFNGIVVDAANSRLFDRIHKVFDAVLYQMKLLMQKK
ncbi:MAG: hypothetical protein IJ604_02440 [Prevotella sp.]|nr:hypothetical protein [Prevotella sp.]